MFSAVAVLFGIHGVLRSSRSLSWGLETVVVVTTRKDGLVLTVYLDQNKWIELAVLKQAVDEGRARFPLSAAHYYETGKQGNRKKRMDLASTMVRLAGTLRIAPPHVIVPWEIRRALVTVFESPTVVPELEILDPA